jgi:eukaryotic translation initiation factor 2C
LIIDQKKHHTKFFIPRKPDNVPPGNLHHLSVCCCNYVGHFLATLLYSLIILMPLSVGTIVDNKVWHPKNFDFYMCSHAGMVVIIICLWIWSAITCHFWTVRFS